MGAKSLLILGLSGIFLGVCALPVLSDTPGAIALPDSDEKAGNLSWEGVLEDGVPKEITITLYDDSYIIWEGRTTKRPTVRFVVKHADESCWGSVIQGIIPHKYPGKNMRFEQSQFLLTPQDDCWTATVTVVTCESVIDLSVHQGMRTQPRFGVVISGRDVSVSPVVNGVFAQLTPQQLERAMSIHLQAWTDVTRKAKSDDFYKYALYTSRVLAVKHPEIYLQGDGLFVEHITTQEGFAAAYEERAPHADGFYNGFSGQPFSFEQIDYSALRTVDCKQLYPSEAPFFAFLDRRALSVACCLKTALGTVTELEKAFIYYFDRRRETDALPFIIYSDNERAYLSTSGQLFSVREWNETSSVSGNPILIFNEESVWYPLMERDDTDSDSSLKHIVEQYATGTISPSLTEAEEHFVKTLQSVTKLEDSADRGIGGFSAVLGLSYESSLHRETAEKLAPGYPGELWRYTSCFQSHLASYLSPFATYLAGNVQKADWTSMLGMTNQWHILYRTQHGHIWPREGAGADLVHKTIDGMIRNRYGHCVQHAASISAVLDLAGVTNYHFDTNPNGNSKGGHSFVSVPEIGCIISNGEVDLELRDTVLDAGTPFEGNQIWNTLRYAASGSRWATPYIGFYCGNWPPTQLAHELEYLESLYGDEIHGYTSRFGKTVEIGISARNSFTPTGSSRH